MFGQTNKSPEFLKKFPLGKIPSFETSSGFHLTESNAIAYYLCESGPKKDQLLGNTPEERALVHQWVFFTSEHLNKTVGALVRPVVGLAPHDPKVEEESLKDLHHWMKYLNEYLQERSWILPNRETGPSLGDIAVAKSLRVGFRLYVDEDTRNSYPNIMKWWNRLLSVPEVEKAFGGNVLLEKKPA